eukprot:Mycagemm_TRINITY_DN8964_c0_g1::TRINITY_DN8964_c0_g1_i1::g.5590::m.5590 type:complete len:108 gc:universal TRINITY_DN8964_c0_g1_i1:63-386(+)
MPGQPVDALGPELLVAAAERALDELEVLGPAEGARLVGRKGGNDEGGEAVRAECVHAAQSPRLMEYLKAQGAPQLLHHRLEQQDCRGSWLSHARFGHHHHLAVAFYR